ncbi:MAG: MFS transporter [Brevinematia bacterium]
MEKWKKEREFSLKISIIEGSISSISGAILHQGFFLQSFIIFIGAPDFWISIIPNLQFALSFIGILSAYYLSKYGERKKAGIITNTIYRCIWILPPIALLIFGKSNITFQVFLITTLISFIAFRLLMVIWMRWMDLLIFEETRGRYLGIRKAFTTLFLLVGFLVGGYILKIFKESAKEEWAYIILFTTIAIIGVISSYLYSYQFDTKTRTLNVKFKEFIKIILNSIKNNPRLKRIILFFAVFEGVSAIGVPFIPVQILKNFNLSPEYLSIQFSIYALSMTISSYLWGILLDKFGPRSVLQLSTLGLSFTISLWVLVPKELWFVLSFIEPTISGIMSGGYESVFMYIILSEVSLKHKDYFFSLVSTINGFSILIGSLISMGIIMIFSNLNVFIFYKNFKVYELLFLITLIGRISTSLLFIPPIKFKNKVKNAWDLIKVTFSKIFEA